MNSKQIIQDALNHKQPERVPIDFGGTGQTGIHVSCVEALRDYYWLKKEPVKAVEPYQMLGLIEDCIGCDTQAVDIGYTMFGFLNENWKEWKTHRRQVVLVAEDFNTTTDDNGDILIFPQGDTTAPHSAKMPKSSFFFDAIVRQEPIEKEKHDPKDNTEEFSLFSDEDLSRWEKEIQKVQNNTRALVANIGGTDFGDITLAPAVQLKNPKGIRDIEEWYI